MPPELIDSPEGTDLGKDDILEALNDESTTDKKDEKVEDKNQETDKELEHIEDEDNEEKDQLDEEGDFSKIDELEYQDIPKRQVILKEYPDLFKKFPAMEHALYREKEYAQVFTTPSDAKEAAEDQKRFKEFESDLMSGNIENVLASVKQSDSKAFGKITTNILNTLAKVDSNAYYGAVNHVLKHGLKAALDHAVKEGDDQLEIAAKLVHKFVYNSHEIEVPAAQQQEQENPQQTEFNKQQAEFAQGQFNSAIENVTGRTDKAIIDHLKKNLDPRGLMSDYVKQKAIDDVMARVKADIGKDDRLKAILGKLWQESAKNKFNDDSKTKIVKALLSKAKTILQPITQKVKADALKGHSHLRKIESDDKEDEKPEKRSQAAPRQKSSKEAVPRDMSTLDYINQD